MSATLALGVHTSAVNSRLQAWEGDRYGARLWAKDHTLWTADLQPEIVDRLGWLDLPQTMQGEVAAMTAFAAEVKEEGTRQIVLMGMGGSSLAPEVYARTFGSAPGYPELLVLDSTHPDAVRAVDEAIDLAATLFVFASKSGTTLEPLSFFRYFWARTAEGVADPGRHFVAITDPGTPLQATARDRGFRRVFTATPDVGGRYSALTSFGLVPAALIGVDIAALLASAAEMAAACGPAVPAEANPGLRLGAALGELARAGCDKATYLVSPSLAAFPGWAEQLIAESTGKAGTGILPVADEPAGPAADYGDDRFFIYLRLASDEDDAQAAAIDALEAAGHPVARISLANPADLGLEIYRAEVAVAASGSVLGIQPFNQPNVQLAKKLAERAMAGELNAAVVTEIPADDTAALDAAVAAWLSGASAGDYVALQAYLAPTAATSAALAGIRLRLRDGLGLATTVGYGPRFLHSTGQFHKGGPNTGLFLQIVDRSPEELPVPETDFGFRKLIAGQALGDYQALAAIGRPVLRVQLGADVPVGLAALAASVDAGSGG